MVWSKITKVLDAFTVVSGSTTFNSSSINTQRLLDERGHFQIDFSGSPGAGTTGTITLQGRLSPDAPFVDVQDQSGSKFQVDVALESEGGDVSSTNHSANATSIPMLPEVRLHGDTDLTNQRNLDAWIIE